MYLFFHCLYSLVDIKSMLHLILPTTHESNSTFTILLQMALAQMIHEGQCAFKTKKPN